MNEMLVEDGTTLALPVRTMPPATPRHGDFAALLAHCACSIAARLNLTVQLLPVSATVRCRTWMIAESSAKVRVAIGARKRPYAV